MNIKTIIPSILNDLVGARVYWNTTPDTGAPRGEDNEFLSFIIAQDVGGVVEVYIDQSTPQKKHARVQLHSVTNNPIGSEVLAETVLQTMLASPYPVEVYGGPVDTYDQDRKLYGQLQIFGIWFDR